MKSLKLFSWFRKVAFFEGLSFIILLGVAMPLKYIADMPKAVTIVGSAHGALFVTFIVLAWEAKNALNKSLGWLAKAFLASIIPFGTFVLDREWKKEEQSIQKDIR